MKDVDALLKEGAERRKREANRRKLLEDLRSKSIRKKWLALPCAAGFCFYFWFFTREFISNEPMLKGDVFSLMHHSFMCAWLLYMCTSALYVDRRDLFLIELLEKEIQNKN